MPEGEKAAAQDGPETVRLSIGLENEADQIHREAIGRLFAEEQNAIEVIKWKEILDLLERASDECEDVANEIEGVVVKYA